MSSRSQFLSGGMTPRAWRMIVYSCIGLLAYGSIEMLEKAQEYQLNRVDRQMQMVSGYDLEESSVPVTASSDAVKNSTY